MRAPPWGAPTVAVLALVLLRAGEARAQQCTNPLVSTCINADAYWPNPGPQRFFAVGSAETVAERQIGFGLMASYQSRPVVVRVASPGPGGSDQFAIDNQVNASFLFAYGVTNRLELDAAFPITLVQTGAGTSPLTGGRAIRDTAVRDLRFGLTYAIVPRERTSPEKAAEEGGLGRSFALAGRMMLSAPIGDNLDFAGERTVVYAPSLAGDYRLWRFFFGLDVGARIRPTTEFAGARIGTQLTTAAGAGFDILRNDILSVLLEGRAYYNFAEQHDSQQSILGITSRPNGEHIVPSEWTLGVRSAPLLDGDLSFFAGGGGPLPGMPAAITQPRFRFMLGVTYAPIARDSDRDGVPDRIDRCPDRPGVKGGETPGCPLAEPAVPMPMPGPGSMPAPIAPEAPGQSVPPAPPVVPDQPTNVERRP